MHVKPSDSCGPVFDAINTEPTISVRTDATCDVALFGSAPVYAPVKEAGIGTIDKKFAETFRSERIPSSHVTTSLGGRDVVRAGAAVTRCFGPLILGH